MKTTIILTMLDTAQYLQNKLVITNNVKEYSTKNCPEFQLMIKTIVFVKVELSLFQMLKILTLY